MRWQITLLLSVALVAATSPALNTLEKDLLALPGNDVTESTRPPPEHIGTITDQQLDVINLIGNSEENGISGETESEEPLRSAEQYTERNQITTEKNMRITDDPGNVSQKTATNLNDDNDGTEPGSGGIIDSRVIDGEGNHEGGGGGNKESGGSKSHELGGGGNNKTASGENSEEGGGGNQEGSGCGELEVGGGEKPEEVGERNNDSKDHEQNNAQSHQNMEEGGVQFICEGVQQEDVTVNTTTGQVQGHCWQNNSEIISYIDIPYGSFDGMFEDPARHEPFESIHADEYHKKRCPQMLDDEYVGDKDCLTLSIFTPFQATDASVLFHIHEGYFNKGSGDPAIYGPEHLVLKGIILVLPNYRLGPLGFLCLQNTTAPGNAALKDLTLALKWIQANIQRFGGNASNIAVSGDGTAGALAGYLALSPLSKNYVNKVITESGSVLSHWALDRNPTDTAKILARTIGEFDSWQNVELSTVIKAGKDLIFRPCLERNISNVENFMLATPWTMIQNQELTTAFIIGTAQYAGVHDFFNDESISVQGLIEDVVRLLPNDLKFQTSNERNSVAEKIKSQYFNESAGLTDVEKLAEYFTDLAYLGPGIRTARSLVNSGATVFFYEFSFVGGFNRELITLENPVEGAIKGDIVGYLFVCECQNEKYLQERDSRMVDQLTELWTTFLKDGVPTVNIQNNNIIWNKLEDTNDTNEDWLSIDETIIMKKGLHLDRLRLWTEIYDKHFIERNLASGFSPSVNTVLILQIIFLLSFFRNASHFIH